MKPIIEILQIAELEVKVTAVADTSTLPHKINYQAECGKSKPVKGCMTMPASVHRLPEHLDKDHADFVLQLAKEAAGHERSRLHLEGKFQ